MTYAEKLKDPRWQKKRLEIMSRDKFTCQRCKDATSTLNVHHRYYEKSAMPWEYPNDALVTYCQKCHSLIEKRIASMNKAIHGKDYRQARFQRLLAADMEDGPYSSIVFSFTIDAVDEFLNYYQEAVCDDGDLEEKRLEHVEKLKSLAFDVMVGLDGAIREGEKVLLCRYTAQLEAESRQKETEETWQIQPRKCQPPKQTRKRKGAKSCS
jgi:hypothetical protein